MTPTSHQYESRFLREVQSRGFLHQCTDLDGLDALLHEGEKTGTPVPAYIGFDCTGKSLHAGSLLPIMLLRLYQECGHKPIVLMGGGTTRVGDPSGKAEDRPLLTDADIAENMAGIKKVFAKYLTFGSGPADAVMVNNADWLDGLKYIDFLREVGRHFSVNRMLSMDSVKLRIEREQHLSFLEFNYMILQAYDFAELYKRVGCRLQFGGSDQWGNIVQGVDLNRKLYEVELEKNGKFDGFFAKESESPSYKTNSKLFGLTTPLLTTSSGAKMGKTADGAIWLDDALLTPYAFWQYWRNSADADIGRFLRLYTTLPLAEITRLENLPGAQINEAKKILATEVTALCHGRAAAEEAAATAQKTFEQGGTAEGLPTIDIPRAELEAGIPAFALFQRAGLAASGGEARRLIRGGGARINDEPVKDENAAITATDTLKLSAGKKHHVLVRIV